MRKVQLCALALVVMMPLRVVGAQAATSGGAGRTASSGTVAGTVHDSIAHAPLAGALVQLAAADSASAYGSTVSSDSVGRFTFLNVPAGRYMVGFYHPVLDSLGLEPMLSTVTVANDKFVRVNLAVPSAARLRMTICGQQLDKDAGALVLGIVRSASNGNPITNAKVTAEWTELTIGRTGMSRQIVRRVAETQANGWYAICNAPRPGTISLRATVSADSTDAVDAEISSSGFLQHALFVGAARTISVNDTTANVGRSAVARTIHVGDGKVSGTVVSAEGDHPLAGAQVSIASGPETRTNDRGEWVLINAPTGTRTLEVRAVGHYPVRRSVDVLGIDAMNGTALVAQPVRVALVTFKSVLDAVKVTANYSRYSDLAGFRERIRSGMGRYLSAADIARRGSIATSELFRMVPGLYLDGGSDMDKQVQMRGVFDERCTPAIYINSHFMNQISANDLDNLVRPEEIIGIEVYSQTQAPPQFQAPQFGADQTACGSIVIWTK